MSKRALRRLATSIYLSVSLVFLGQITAFADVIDETIKPVHEYTFDSEARTLVVDTGSTVVDGVSSGTNHEVFFTGYNGTGKARYFNGTDDYLRLPNNEILSKARSIRFKMKKDASTISGKLETILSTNGASFTGGDFIGIGSEMFNDRGNNYPRLSAKAGTLYIVSYHNARFLNFEIQSPQSVCDGQWHDVLFTWDGTTNANSVKLYLDDMTTPVAQTTAAFAPADDGMPTSIGRCAGDISEKLMYNGYLDNIQIYDSAIITNPGDPSNPGDPTNPGDATGKQALLVITMVTDERKEYEMTADKISDFIAWYNSKAASSPTYMIEKDYNKASFTARKDYIAYDQISNFEVNEYNN